MQTCSECNGTKFGEAVQYVKVKDASQSKMAMKGSDVLLTFCVECGTVAKVKLANPGFE